MVLTVTIVSYKTTSIRIRGGWHMQGGKYNALGHLETSDRFRDPTDSIYIID